MGSTIKEVANAYQPKKTRNISEMEVVNIDNLNVEVRDGTDNNGKDFHYSVVIKDGEEYRIPDSVLGSIKTILGAKPNLKTVKVIRKGQGMNTEYTVVPLD
jgi:uncharacterized protein (UPF0216 family)